MAAFAVGTYYGLKAFSTNREGEKGCDARGCSQDALNVFDRSDRAATVSTVAFGVGLVGAGVALYSALTGAPSPRAALGGPLRIGVGKESGYVTLSSAW